MSEIVNFPGMRFTKATAMPSHIPEDVQRTAREIVPSGTEHLVADIANAILAEAERCAKIVDEIGNGLMDMTPAEAAKAIRRGN